MLANLSNFSTFMTAINHLSHVLDQCINIPNLGQALKFDCIQVNIQFVFEGFTAQLQLIQATVDLKVVTSIVCVCWRLFVQVFRLLWDSTSIGSFYSATSLEYRSTDCNTQPRQFILHSGLMEVSNRVKSGDQGHNH